MLVSTDHLFQHTWVPLRMAQESKIGTESKSDYATFNNALLLESVCHILTWALIFNLLNPERIVHDLVILDNVIDDLYAEGQTKEDEPLDQGCLAYLSCSLVLLFAIIRVSTLRLFLLFGSLHGDSSFCLLR